MRKGEIIVSMHSSELHASITYIGVAIATLAISVNDKYFRNGSNLKKKPEVE